MNKTIWTCWLQKRENAPDLVKRCISSWETKNPDWTVRCLDAHTVPYFVDLDGVIDLKRQSITAASLTDVIRILLLREYGGIWVDATVYCNQALNEWLDDVFVGGFFAFAAPGEDRPLSTWFLAAESTSPVVAQWCARVVRYWDSRTRTGDYFWFHHEFGALCASNPEFAALWERIPKISAIPPHAVQSLMYADTESAARQIDWTVPVFKLTHRVDPDAYRPRSLMYDMVHGALPRKRSATGELPNDVATPRVALSPLWWKSFVDPIEIAAVDDLLHRIGASRTLAGAGVDVPGAAVSTPAGSIALSLPARTVDSKEQNVAFIVSPDDDVVRYVAKYIDGTQRVECDAGDLLLRLRSSARLVVTTMATCAFAALGMGVPVLAFYRSVRLDRLGGELEAFSVLERLIPVFRLDRENEIDWRGYGADVGGMKLAWLDAALQWAAEGRFALQTRPLGPVAPSDALPAPV
jgi:Capsular polysaccharide synthesis protein